MAEITLRSYSQEIDGLIELERLDEAIAHCRQILQAYPKHLDTYRLLGKAYLEAKRYSDASDIFQRVLSSEPADFVAHIGMSVIREDDGNLDSAIWHMERAFETNPANQVIQQELKRLFGGRDGVEPSKVRLTRGALARMYANGELYPQAVAELRAALQEDPNRPDLQILLAEMHWRTNQHLEAAEVCSRVLHDLPHCRAANRIMAAVLQSSGKSDAAAVYLRRLAAIDPYTAFLESPAGDPARVEAESITLEKIEWQSGGDLGEFVRNKPDWATSLGAELSADEKAPEGTPSWLEMLSATPAEEVPAGESPGGIAAPPAASSEISALPDWIRASGWDEASGEAQEQRLSFSDDELRHLEKGALAADDLAPADIPGWLRDIAPAEIAEGDVAPADDETAEGERALPDWLRGIADDIRLRDKELETPLPVEDQAASEESPELETPPAAASYEGREVPSWLEEAEPGASESIVSWLGSRLPKANAEDAQAPADAKAAAPESEEDDTISWLRGVAEAAAQEEPKEEQPLSLSEMIERGDFIRSREEAATAATRELSPDRLIDFAGAQEEVSPKPAEDAEAAKTKEPIRWQPEFDASKATQPVPQPPPAADDVLAEMPEKETADWLKRLSEERQPSAAPAPPAAEEPEVPEWLRTLATDTSDLKLPETPATEQKFLADESTALPEVSEVAGETEPIAAEASYATESPELESPAEPEPAALDAVAELKPLIPEEPPRTQRVLPDSLAWLLQAATDTPTKPEPGAPEAPVKPAEARPEVRTEAPPVMPASTKPARRVPTAKLSPEQAIAKLDQARLAIKAGDIQKAAEHIGVLVREKHHLSQVIENLQEALERHPDVPLLWQLLGDAHMRADRLSDAVDAYRQGLESI